METLFALSDKDNVLYLNTFSRTISPAVRIGCMVLPNQLWLNKSTIQRYETGKITKIKVPVIHAIAKQLNVDPNWLMGESEKMGEYVPRFDKFEKWEDEIQRKRIAENDTSFELDYSRSRKRPCRISGAVSRRL